MVKPISDTFKPYLEGALSFVEQGCKMLFTTDRKFQKFGEGEQQLYGRSRQTFLSLFSAAVCLTFAGLMVGQFLGHPSFGNFFMCAGPGVAALMLLREASIQSMARAKEKAQMGLEESENTVYTPNHFFNEVGAAYGHIFTSLVTEPLKRISNVIRGSQPEEIPQIEDEAL